MISWLKKLYKDMVRDTADDELVMNPREYQMPDFKCNVPMPSVKPTKPEKNISEPVWAIVETMKKYPSRFKGQWVENETKIHINGYPVKGGHWKVNDLKTKQEILVKNDFYEMSYEASWEWLTTDEVDLLYSTYTQIYKNKVSRLHSIQRAKMSRTYK